MPNNITENTRRFIENADIDYFTYFTYFIKAWIPFNAWYKNKWQDLHSDRDAINSIKDNVNETRSTIVNYLDNNSDGAKTFRSYLSSLHFQLLENDIRNKEVRISFENVQVGRNRNNQIDHEHKNIRYQLARARNGSININVTKLRTGDSACEEISQDIFNIEDLRDHREYRQLTQYQQSKLMTLYREIIPYESINLIEPDPRNDREDRPLNYSKVGSFAFVESKEKIAQGLIEVMYSLRCVLFHGELNPNEANNEVYKNLYHILFMILQKLR